MKPRHAAALALVGWYLLGPPLKADLKIDADAPFSRWKTIRVYDTADACEVGRTKTMALAEQDLRHPVERPHDPYPQSARRLLDEEIHFAQCIATDDPRLKDR